MKKFLALALAFAMSMTLLAGCAAKPAQSDQTAEVDLEAFYQTIFTDPENTPAMGAMDDEMLEGFYPGLTAVERKQTVAYMPMITAVACEIVMVECANAEDVDTVKELFETRVKAQVENNYNYPSVVEAWEKEAKVVANGSYVALFVVSGMTEQVVENFNAACKG